MGWRKYLLVPRLMLTSLGAPRSPHRAWERYWSQVRRTGPDGDVLWDAGDESEVDYTEAQLRQHADLSLPIVDLGCGSGRQARALTGLASRVLGIDGSPAAIRHAVADTVAALLGRRGVLYLSETDNTGDPLDYLIAQEARPTHLPGPVHRLVRSGLRPPRHFGPAELAAFFPQPGWRILGQGPTVLYGLPVVPGGPPQEIPGLFAVLRPRA